MKSVKRIIIILCILLSCVSCDQVSKMVAKKTLPPTEAFSFLNDTFRLQYTENTGAFLSLGAHVSEGLRYWIFTVFVSVLLLGTLIFILITNQLTNYQTIAMSLLLGGGFGNLVDRILNEGSVVDFLNLGFGSLRTGVFNLADVAITIGVCWLFYLTVRIKKDNETC